MFLQLSSQFILEQSLLRFGGKVGAELSSCVFVGFSGSAALAESEAASRFVRGEGASVRPPDAVCSSPVSLSLLLWVVGGVLGYSVPPEGVPPSHEEELANSALSLPPDE